LICRKAREGDTTGKGKKEERAGVNHFPSWGNVEARIKEKVGGPILFAGKMTGEGGAPRKNFRVKRGVRRRHHSWRTTIWNETKEKRTVGGGSKRDIFLLKGYKIST